MKQLHYNIKRKALKHMGYEFNNRNYISYRKQCGRWEDDLNHTTIWVLPKGEKVEINDYGEHSSMILEYLTQRYENNEFDMDDKHIAFYFNHSDSEIVSYQYAHDTYRVPIMEEYTLLVLDTSSTLEERVACLQKFPYDSWNFGVFKIKQYEELITELNKLQYYIK